MPEALNWMVAMALGFNHHFQVFAFYPNNHYNTHHDYELESSHSIG